MHIHIGESILEFLHTGEAAHIPELGVFNLTSSASTFTLENHVLSPPNKELTFVKKDGSAAFTKFISGKYGIAFSTADLVLKKFARKTNNAVLNFGHCALQGLGSFDKETSNETKFTPAVSNFHPKYPLLAPITLKPLNERSVSPESVVQQSSVSKIAASESAAVVGAITAAKATNGVKSEKTVNEIVDQTQKGVSKTTSPANSGNAAPPTEKKKSLSQSLNEAYKEQVSKSKTYGSSQASGAYVYEEPERSFLSRYMIPILLFLLVLSVFGCVKYCGGIDEIKSNFNKNASTSLDSENTSADSKSSDSANAGIPDDIKNNPNYIKYKDVLTAESLASGCIIIVGSYTKSTNAVRMKDKVIRAGLEPYSETYGEYTRVGTLFDCLEQDLDEYLQSMRTSFDGKSWYLSPDYEVPYK